MKKISKLALLAAATAFLLAAFPACSNDDDDGNSGATPTDTVSPDSFELTSGAEPAEKAFTLTLGTTQINETGLAALKADDLTSQIDTIVSQSSDITVSALKVTEDATATTLKFSLTMASDAAANTKGTLTLTLPADFTANGKAIEMPLSYEIKGNTTTPPNDDDPKDPPASATAKTYIFTGKENGIVATDISNWDLSAKDVINAPKSEGSLTTKALANGASISWKGSSVGTLRFRAKHDANSGTISDLAPTITALNYNGGLKDADITNGVTISDLDRYVSIPVDGAGTITASIKVNGSSGKTGNLQVALADKDGKLIGTVVTAAAADGKITDTDSTEGTVIGSVAAATDVYLVFSRNGAGGGGIDVYSITVAPDAN